MDIKEFIQIHEYINSCLCEKDEELISIIEDIRYELFLIKNKLKIKDETISYNDTISGNNK